MADGRVEFELAMKDLATKELERFRRELEALAGSSGKFNASISEGEKLLKQFYMEQRVQDRTMREATQALTGFTVGMSGLVASGANSSKSVKQFNDTILASVTAMQGAEFAAASLGIAGRNLGGRLGSVAQTLSANSGYVGAVIGATTAVFGLAKALADYLYPQVDKSFKFDNAAASVRNLSDAFKQFQSNEKYKEELKKYIADHDKFVELNLRIFKNLGSSKDVIAKFLKEETDKYKFAKAELERLMGGQSKQSKSGKNDGGINGGDDLLEKFKAWEQLKTDIVQDEVAKRISANKKTLNALYDQLEREKKMYATFSDSVAATMNDVLVTKFNEALGNQNSILEIFLGNFGARLIAWGAEMLAQALLNAIIAKSMTTAAIAAETAKMTALLAVAGPTALAVNIASFGAAGYAAAASAAAATTAQLVGMAAVKFHNGGTVGNFASQPSSREFPVMVRGGETVRTEGQERDLQNRMSGRGMNVTININGDGLSPRSVQMAVIAGMRQTGQTVDRYFVNQRSAVSLS